MVAIQITQAIKDNNSNLNWVDNSTLGDIVKRSEVAPTFNSILNYGSINNSDMQIADGWKDFIDPVYDSATQKLGDIILVEPNYTYDVIDLTDQEIQDRLTAQSEGEKQNLIQQILETDTVNNAQSSDDTDSLNSQALFPMWEYPFLYPLGFKCQSFTALNELVLYKCVQSHTSQSDWNPEIVPALFTRVAYPDEVLVWVQPTGAQDAYNIGDKVHYPLITDPIYESLIDANVWSPDALPSGWQLIP